MRELVMKFEDNPELLEEYLDGDMSAEEELFARYDREIEVSPAVWEGIEKRIVPVAASANGWWMKIAAVVVLAIGLGSVFLFERKETQTEPEQQVARFELPKPREETPITPTTPITRIKKRIIPTKRDNPGVVSSELAY